MTRPVSIVVVSRHRPAALRRCLSGIAQLDYPEVEVIVVTCPAGQGAAMALPFADRLKMVPFDEANISLARNLGIAQAAGEIVAFIDDDAVPEPMWLHHLCAPFDTEEVAATGGFVIGRNGISLQWGARSVDRTGDASPLDVSDSHATVLHPTDERAIKTEGTNMAVRRDVLAAMGGFDPVFRFYLDETDLNLRLARAGHATALVPLARVHHGFAESARRAPDRTPRDLTEIAASQRAFLRKHCPRSARDAAWDSFRQGQRLRLLRLMQRGPLDPLDVTRLMRGLDRGGRLGAERPLDPLPALPHAASGFRPVPTRPGAQRIVLSGRPWQARALRDEAARRVAEGHIVSLFLFSPTARPHRVTFSPTGVWEQTGGLCGRSDRNGPALRYWRFDARCTAEYQRVAKFRT